MSIPDQISLEEAQTRLSEIVHRIKAGDEVIVIEGQHAVARILGPPSTKRPARQPGSAKGRLRVVAEDDEHLKDFEKYMP